MSSRCPGHPEFGHTSGVETTTGPLGQGVANSVGMAIASYWLAGRYNKPGFEIFDYNVYAVCGDGDMMEGISSEAASMAGHLRLSNLCWIYDDNKITIEGDTSLAFSEDVGARFVAYGWNVVKVDDVNDLAKMRQALRLFEQTKDKPTLIIVRSNIAWGAPNAQDTHGAHGAPLGEEEIRLTKQVYGWPENEKFLVPAEVAEHFRQGVGANGQRLYTAWKEKFSEYVEKHPELAAEVDAIFDGRLPHGWDSGIAEFAADAKGVASRASSGKVLNQVARNLPWLLGGSADLAPSNKSDLTFEGAGEFSVETPAGRNFHFGIREHAMGAIVNGMALSGLRSYGATFFVFADYLRPSMRLAALMKLPVFYIFTHDSIGVGEDGPTHQPVEQLASLRAIPGLVVLRPADANEVAEAYRIAVSQNNCPTALVLTRQNLPTLDRSIYAPAEGTAQGAYVLSDCDGKADVILIGSGSEVSLCLAAQKKLVADGVKARVVSMPSWELFEQQDQSYQESVLPPEITCRVAVEAGVEQGWQKYIGCSGRMVAMKGFGASAPYDELMEHFGLTSDNVVAQAKAILGK
jgi:transketolase